MKGATWSRTIFFFFSLAKWCDTLASHFLTQRWLWMLKTDNEDAATQEHIVTKNRDQDGDLALSRHGVSINVGTLQTN
jgi:hypothetical protein